jgi:hypothetical protein
MPPPPLRVRHSPGTALLRQVVCEEVQAGLGGGGGGGAGPGNVGGGGGGGGAPGGGECCGLGGGGRQANEHPAVVSHIVLCSAAREYDPADTK